MKTLQVEIHPRHAGGSTTVDETKDDRSVARALASMSTSTEAQEHRIIEALRSGPKTTDQLRAIGCYQVSARIFKLRALGHVIETELFTGYAADGLRHARMARYTLIGHEVPSANEGSGRCS